MSDRQKLKKRELEFDLLRSIVILGSIILHFNTKFGLGLCALPFQYIQDNLFTVGAFFFFTAGVMAYRVYLPRFQIDKALTAKHIIFKGLSIIGVYFAYITLMRLATKTDFPAGFLNFTFSHPFFLKVLFTFGLLYILTPVFLQVAHVKQEYIYLGLVITYIVFLVLGDVRDMPGWLRMICFDRHMLFYPIVPSLIVYFWGFSYGIIMANSRLSQKITGLLMGKIFLILLFLYLIFLAINMLFLKYIWANSNFVAPIREGLTIACFIVIANGLLERFDGLRSRMSSDALLCLGTESLTAYVTANILIGLIRPVSGGMAKCIILASILTVTYLIATWRHGYKYCAGISR
ncbi:MAG: hypothetical protein AB1711_04200 [Thermodesulfobacteriota bacterium]